LNGVDRPVVSDNLNIDNDQKTKEKE
jgi:hypothetical protein